MNVDAKILNKDIGKSNPMTRKKNTSRLSQVYSSYTTNI